MGSRSEMFDDGELSTDAFLGGRLSIMQPIRGYRAAADPVLLAAAVPARAGDAVLELGCGAGVASLCLGQRVPGLIQFGLELQPAYAALARRNAHLRAKTEPDYSRQLTRSKELQKWLKKTKHLQEPSNKREKNGSNTYLAKWSNQ